MTRFMKTALSAATALSLSIAPVPAAAADRDDIAGALAGLFVLGVIANAASDNNNRSNSNTRMAQRNVWQDDFATIEERNRTRTGTINGTIRRLDQPARAKSKRGYKKAKLPDRCLRIVETRNANRLVYSNRCLSRYYKHASKLPDRCERFVRTNRGTRTVFGARCLARDGWQVARR